MIKYFTPASWPWRVMQADGNDNVKGNGEHLQTQEKDEPMAGRGDQDHAQGGIHQQAVKFVPGEIPETAVAVNQEKRQTVMSSRRMVKNRE